MAESVDAPDLKSVERKVRGGSSPPTPITPLNIGGVSDKPMKYRIETKYAWYDHEGEHLVLLYLITKSCIGSIFHFLPVYFLWTKQKGR